MKSLLILLGLLFFCQSLVQAQEEYIYFNKTFWSDTMNTITPAIEPIEDGYIVLGNYVSVADGQEHIYLRKTDKYGSTQWVKEIDNESNAELNIIGRGTQMILTKDEQHIVLTYSKDTVALIGEAYQDITVAKLDLDGNTIWTKSYNRPGKGEIIRQIAETSDGGFILGGSNWASGQPGAMYILKLDSEGQAIWDKEYAENWGRIFTIQQTWWDEGYVFSGWSVTDEDVLFHDMHVIKVDHLGEIEWEQILKHEEPDVAAKIIPITTPDNFESIEEVEYLLIGAYNNPESLYSNDHFSAKLNFEGEIVWEKHYPELLNITSFQTYPIIKDGKFIMNALQMNEYNMPDNLLVEFLLEGGHLLWTKKLSFNPTEQVYFKDMDPTPDGGYVLAGYQFTDPPQKGWIVKVDNLGNTCQLYDCDSSYLVQGVGLEPFEQHSSDSKVFTISPNPCDDQFSIYPKSNITVGNELFDFALYNSAGALIYHKKSKLNTSLEIDIKNQKEGIYFYEISSRNQQLQKGKLIKTE